MCVAEGKTSPDIFLPDLRGTGRPRLITLQVLRHRSYLMSDDGCGWLPSACDVQSNWQKWSKGFTHFLCHHRSHEFLKKRSFHDRHVTDSMMEGKEEEALWRIKLRSNTPSHCIITCDKRGVILYNFMPCVFSCFCIHHARLCGNISTLLFEMTGLHGHKVLPRGPPWVKPPSESVATNYMVSHYTGVNKAQTPPFGTAMSVVLATVVWLIRNIETTNSFL